MVGYASQPSMSQPHQPATQFSPDYAWWWDGSEWKPAISADHLWRWDGQRWVPAAQAHAAPRGTGLPAWLVVVLSFGGVILLVLLLVFIVLLTMGNQIANVFSNVTAALAG
jgi:hypothetical protein